MSDFVELVICFIATLILHFAEIFLFEKLSNRKPFWRKSVQIIILLFVCVQVLLNILGMQLFGTAITIIYFYILFQKLFNCKKLESKNISIIIWIIALLIDIFLMVLGAAFNLIKFYNLNIKVYKSIASILMATLLVIIGKMPNVIQQLKNLVKKMSKVNIKTEYILTIVVVFLGLGLISSNHMMNKIMILIYFSIGLLILVIIVLLISMYYQIVTLKMTNEILEKNNEVNQKAIYQYRVLKHNLESQLLGVKTVANKKARELLDNLIKEYNESFYIKHDINSMPLGINGLVFDKLYKYNEDNIEISITNKIKSKILDTVGPRSYNLFCEALGVTLDNALESAKESKDKLVYIEFRENKEVIQMKIMNTFHGSIDLDKLGTVNYTSKSKGHGLGLYSLFGRKNLTITTSIKNNLFVNKIEVKKLN